jgi:hypothetical protein
VPSVAAAGALAAVSEELLVVLLVPAGALAAVVLAVVAAPVLLDAEGEDVEVAAAGVAGVGVADAEVSVAAAGELAAAVGVPGAGAVPDPGLCSFAASAAMIDCQDGGKPVVERDGGWPGCSWYVIDLPPPRRLSLTVMVWPPFVPGEMVTAGPVPGAGLGVTVIVGRCPAFS